MTLVGNPTVITDKYQSHFATRLFEYAIDSLQKKCEEENHAICKYADQTFSITRMNKQTVRGILYTVEATADLHNISASVHYVAWQDDIEYSLYINQMNYNDYFKLNAFHLFCPQSLKCTREYEPICSEEGGIRKKYANSCLAMSECSMNTFQCA